MTRAVFGRFLAAAGLAVVLFLLAFGGVVFPTQREARATSVARLLRAAPAWQPASSCSCSRSPGLASVLLQTAPATQTATVDAALVPTSTVVLTQTPRSTPLPEDTATPDQTPTATATLTVSPTSTPTEEPTEVVTPTDTCTPSPTPTQTPTATPTFTPTATFTPVPTLTPTATPSFFERAMGYLPSVPQSGLLMAVACLAPVLILGLLFVLWFWRRKGPTPTQPPQPPFVGPYLETVGGPGGPRRFELKPEGVTIGRSRETEHDVVVTQEFPAWETVSRRHARIYQQDDRWIVEDLDSMNGIYVNGRRTGRNILRDGWQLGVGAVEFVFHTGTGEA